MTETFAILAVRGAGKSNTARVMAEEMFAAGAPFVAVDPVGSWWGLRAGRDGNTEGGLQLPIFGGKHGDVPLEKTGGTLIADLVVDQRLSCVLDVSDFDSEGAKKRFLLDFARQLYKRNEAPLHLFLEEADDYIPQTIFGGGGRRGEERVEPQLLRAWENVVRRGRARGLGITLITQRSAAINKSVLTQVGTLIAMRTTSPQDRAAVDAWVKYHGEKEELLASLAQLEDGDAWVWSPEFLKQTVRVHFRLSHTFDSGSTPKVGKSAKPRATLADVDLGEIQRRMAATIEKAKAEDPRHLRAEIARLKKELGAKKPAAPAPSKPKIEQVEVSVLKEAQVKRLESAVGRLEKAGGVIATAGSAVVDVARELAAALRNGHRAPLAPPAPLRQSAPPRPPPRPPTRRPLPTEEGDIHVSGPQQRILDALDWLESVGLRQAEKKRLAFMADASPKSSSYTNNLGALHTAGLVTYPQPGQVALSDAGRARANPQAAPLTTAELQEQIIAKLSGPQGRILRELIRIYPDSIVKPALADLTGASAASSSFTNNLGYLRGLQLIDYPTPGEVAAEPVLFLEEP